MAESLAKYVVSLEAETARYRAELQKANNTLQQFTRAQQKALDTVRNAFFALGGAVAASKFSGWISSAIDAADNASKLSQKIGVSTETITGLALGLDLAGVSTEEFSKAMLRLARVASDADAGLATAQRTFQTLGISVKASSGALKTADVLLSEIAGKFSQLANGTQKAALAQELFGRSGATLIPFLNQGSAAFEQMIAQSRALGLVWTDEAGRAAENFNDSLTVLAAVSRGYASALAQEVLPALNATTAFFVKTSEEGIKVGPVMGSIVGWFKSLAVVALTATTTVSNLFDRIFTLGDVISKRLIPGTLAWKQAWLDLEARIARSSLTLAEAVSGIWENGDNQEAVQQQIAGFAALINAQAGLEEQAKATKQAIQDESAVMAMFNTINNDATRFTKESEKDVSAMFNSMVSNDLDKRKAMRDLEASLMTQEEAIRASYDRQLAFIKANTEEGSAAQIRLIDRLTAKTDEQLKDIEGKTGALTEFGKAAAQNIQSAFADFLFDPFSDGLDGMLSGFLETMKRMVAEVASQQILNGLFGGLSGSTNPLVAGIGAAFSGARANGGQVSAGRSYLVGERGPELFMPSGAGRIVPNGGGGTNVQIVDQRGAGAPPVDISRQMSGGMERIRVLIRSEVGGMFSDGTMDRQFRAASMPVRRLGSR